MKKVICGLLAAISLFALLAGCNNAPIKEPPEVGFLVAGQFSGYRVGIVESLTAEEEVIKEIGSPEIVKFSSVSKALSDLRNDRIHGLVLPSTYAEDALKKHSDISKLYVTFIDKKICALSHSYSDFIFGINAASTAIVNNGKANKIAETHTTGKGDAVRPAEYDKVEDRVLRIGVVSATGAPLCYKNKDGELCGINIDTAYAFAEQVHAELVVSDYKNDEELIKALDAGEIDLAMNDYIPDENTSLPQEYRFTHPYTDLSTHILIKGETPRVATEGLSALGK